MPASSSEAVRLLHGDCLDLLPTLPARSVDLVLSDWPYGTTACAWDSVIPLDRLWPEIKRVLKPRGAVVLTASQPFTTVLINSNLDWFRYCWVWRKSRPNGFLDANRKPMKAHEDIAVFYPRQCTYNPQGLRLVSKPNRNTGRENVYGKVKPGYQQEVTYTGYPCSVLEYPSISNGLHPTQKPLALFEYLMRTYSNPGDVVLDNAFGSCTTGEAAIRLQRAFIGMERDETYFNLGAARCAAAHAAPVQAVLLDVAQ